MQTDNKGQTESKPKRRFELVESADDGISIRVYPLSYRELELHADALALVMQAVGRIEAATLQSAIDDKSGSKLWFLLAPFAGRSILRMINDCCVPTLAESDAPPDVVAEVAGKWLALSFLRPGTYHRVLKAVEGLIKAATGEQVDLNKQLQSLFSSAISGRTSTTGSGATDTRKEVGLSQSTENDKSSQPLSVTNEEPLNSAT